MRSLKQFSAAVACTLLSHASLAAQVPTPAVTAQPSVVMSSYGPIQGVPAHLANVTMWLGIPYATPPLGELRWQAPRAPRPWTKPLLASNYGNPCMQIGSLYGPPPKGKPWGMANLEVFGKPVGSEDCLTLNIWRPNGAAQNLPVLVYVHGGSGVIGHSSDPIYDGANLANNAQAVIVTINYRLNIFGAFLPPPLKGADAASNSGNYATLDTIQALRFVHDNAKQFGGDAGNVTLMGQSAGGAMVYKVMGSKVASGLFQKAIILSGAIIKSTSLEEGHAFADAFAARLAVTDGMAKDPESAARFIKAKGPAWTRAYLQGKPAADVINTLLHSFKDLPRGTNNFGDGVVMPVDMTKAYEQGNFIRVPTIIGMTRDEAKLLPPTNIYKVDTPERFAMMVQPRPAGSEPLRADDLLKPWFMSSLTSAPYNIFMWGWMKMLDRMAGVTSSIVKVSNHNPQVYTYRFDWNRGPEPWRTVYGAGHSMDLPFIFGNFSNMIFAMEFTEQNRKGTEALSKLMVSSFSAFLHKGDPNVPGLPEKWTPLKAGSDPHRKMVFNASDTGLCEPKGCDE